MSQRYPDNNHIARNLSPPRSNPANIHPSRLSNVDSRPREGIPDAPRGPRASNESYRPYGASRGRGVGRADFRTEYRDREQFRREGSPPNTRRDFRGGRAWSPSLERFPSSETHREFHDQPREFDNVKGRGRYRDSAPGRFVEGRGSHSYFPPREEGPRGRGQIYYPHARGRGGFAEDRGGFRGRSPSPTGRNRWARSPSPRERRQAPDRFDDDRFERRGSDKSFDRDDRSRDDRPRDDERHRVVDRYQPAPSPTTPQSYRPFSGAQSLSAARPLQEGERDSYQPRRVSNSNDMPSGRERTYDSFRPEPQPRRDVNQHSSRPSSPPRPPEVPAFGSLPTKTPVSEHPPWNKWIASEQKQPQQQRQESPPPPPPPPVRVPNETRSDELPTAPPPPPPPVETAEDRPEQYQNASTRDHQQRMRSAISPYLEPQQLAPKAPRAQRRDLSPARSEQSESGVSMKQESPRSQLSSLVTQSIEPPLNAPTAPAPKPPMLHRDSSPMTLRSPPTGPRHFAGVPAGPKMSMSPLAARATLSSPGFNPPSGPRAAPLLSPPVNAVIPRGPRVGRASSMNARPAFAPGGSASWQWNRPDVQTNSTRSLVIPAKREWSSERRNPRAPQAFDQDHEPMSLGQHDGQNDSKSWNGDVDSSSKRQKLDSRDQHLSPEPPAADSKALESASDDEERLSEDDSERLEREFQREVARLKARMADLSAPHLRGLKPLRRLNLLSRLGLEDLSTFFDTPAPKPRKPTTQRVVSQNEGKSPNHAAEAASETAQAEPILPTPILRAPRVPKPSPKLSPSPIGSPELRALPFLNNGPPTPLSDLDAFQENLKRHESLKDYLRQELQRRRDQIQEDEEDLCAQYEEHYRAWRRHVTQLDAEQRDREDAERQDTMEIAMPPVTTEISPSLPTPGETRRRGLHATDYELEKVLEMSKLEAEREAKEKQERDAANAKPNWELEAAVPALLPPQDAFMTQFADTSCLRDPKQMVTTWDLEPEEDDFTQAEHDTMLHNFKDFPKKFGKIAAGLEGRDYKECINHYYATKWNGEYKPPRDKRRKPKTPRVKTGPNARPRASALISNLNEDAKPDLYDGDDAAAPLNAYTESGRPKRAAAPTFKDKDLLPEQAVISTPAKRNGKLETGAERGAERSARKQRAGGKEPKQRRQRARRDSKSPEKMDLDVSGLERPTASALDLEVASQLAALGSGQPALLQRPTNAPAFTVEPSQARIAVGPEAGKIQTVRGGHATNASSYWSVQEVEIFPTLIEKHGTDWVAIATEMGTKTQTMVKNYFNRIKGKGPELERSAKEADERRGRGDQSTSSGPATTPALASKRIKEPVQTRPLAPTGTAEIIELDDEEQAANQPIPARNAPFESVPHSHASQDALFLRGGHGQQGNMSQSYTASSFPPTYAPISQPPFESRTFAPREPIGTASTPAAPQYAPMPRGAPEFGPVSNTQPSMSRPAFQSIRPGVEDVHYGAPPRPAQSRSNQPFFGDSPVSYGIAQSSMTSFQRPNAAERSFSDDARQAQQRLRAPSPQPPPGVRNLLGEPSRPQSTTYLDPLRASTSGSVREDSRVPSRGNADKPPTSSAPKRSNIMSILNNDEPSETPPAGNASLQASSNNPTPPQYGAIPPAAMGAPPPRPASRLERVEYPPGEHIRRGSITSFQPQTYHQAPRQPNRISVEGRQPESRKVTVNSFPIDWVPPSDDQQQRSQREPGPFEFRGTPLTRFDGRVNPSPPPSFNIRDGPSSGHNSPFSQRINLQQLTRGHDPSPPPPRSYGTYPPPGPHSRQPSISHLNPESRHPPPSVLQPQQAPRSNIQQGPPVMQPNIVSRPDPNTSYARQDPPSSYQSRKYAAYAPPEAPSRSLYTPRPDPNANLMSHDHNAANELRHDSERGRIWGIRDDERDRRPTDWTQGLPREARYGPSGCSAMSSQSQSQQPPQSQQGQAQGQPQYAPYQPLERGDRGR